jgi:hypothetical protein
MSLEVVPLLEVGVGAEPAFDLGDPPMTPVLFCTCEQPPVLWAELLWQGLSLLLLRPDVSVLRYFHLHAPLDRRRLFLRRLYHPPLLETRSQQGLMVNSLRIPGREPLRSASRLLGFTINHCFWDPGHRVVARCRRYPVCFTAPGSFWGRSRIAIAMLVTAAFTEGGGG